MNNLNTDNRPARAAVCGLSLEALKRDGVNKRSYVSMDKSFDGMHEKYDFDSIRFSVKKTISISISMIVTSVLSLTVSEIFNVKCNATDTVTLIRPLNKGQGHSFGTNRFLIYDFL